MGRGIDDINEAFPSKFLKAQDVGKRRVKLVVAGATYETMTDGNEKPCLSFQNTDKLLVLNKTNSLVLSEAYGHYPKKWIGREVVLYTAKVQFKERMVDALRLELPESEEPEEIEDENPEPKTKAKSRSMKDELDDEIPF